VAGSTGNIFPTAGANVDRAGNTAWTNPGNIVSDNGSGATTTVPTDYLVTSAYGFNIPVTCRILGVSFRAEATETGSGSSSIIPQLHSNTTPTLIGSAQSAITVTNGPTVVTGGGIANLWSATLTPAIVNAAGFGVSVWSTDTINGLDLDYVTLAIEYGEEAPWLTGRETFRRRRNTTNHRLLVVDLHGAAAPAEEEPEVSADAALDEPFRTVVLRSRKALSVGWIAALTAQIAAPEVPPVGAWLVVQPRKRRETKRRLLVAADAPVERYTPPTIAWSDPPKVIRVEFRRKLQEQAPQLVFPPTTGPPVEYYPAWAARQLPATSQDRRHLVAIEAPVYPETPAAEVSDDRALEAPFVTRTIRSRRHLKAPDILAVDAAPPPEPTPATLGAVTLVTTKRRKSRRGLFLDGGVVLEVRVQAEYPSYAQPHPKKRKSTKRRLLRLPHPASTPATPATPAQPLPAWQTPKQHRTQHTRTLRHEPLQPLFPATPATPAQPLPAWAPPIANRVERVRTRRDVARHEYWPATVTYPANQLVRAIKRRDTKRTLRGVAHADLYQQTPAPFQEPTSWKLAEGFRRHGWRKARFALEIDVYPPTPTTASIVGHRGTGRDSRVIRGSGSEVKAIRGTGESSDG
jgi:hypothetical protein